MKIFAAGIETETNTFSPIPTAMQDFFITRAVDITNGTKTLEDMVPFNQWQERALDRNGQFYFGLFAWAHPAGLTTQTTYESLRDELVDSLKALGPVDIVLLYLHGAMMACNYDDCEGDLLKHIRHYVGANTVIAVELDLHCHLTSAMMTYADLIITLKEFPHIDIAERGEELFDLAINSYQGLCQPEMALFDCKMMGMYPTTTSTMSDFVKTMTEAESIDGILSVSFGHGFPFGDMPDAGGKILVIADGDAELAQALAEKLGAAIFSKRRQIGFDSLPLAEAFEKARAIALSKPASSNQRPVVVADQSDNAGGGAPSDATFALRWLLDHQVENVAMAIFYDPMVVQLAMAAGQGAEIQLRLGGKMGLTSGDPVDLTAIVKSINLNYWHQFPQQQGEPLKIPIGNTVALHSQGIDIVVSTQRCQCFSPCIFNDLGIPVKQKDLLVVKSAQHFYSAFEPIASDIIYMAGSGAVPPVMKAIPYKRLSTNDKYPWVENPFEGFDIKEVNH